MQKKLIALAVAAAFSAPAFADTTVYGILDVGYQNTAKTLETTTSSVKSGYAAFAYSTMTSSRLGFLNTEDLGDGMKSMVKIETGIGSNIMAGVAQTGTKAVSNKGLTIDATSLGNRELWAALVLAQGTTIKAGYGSTLVRDISLGYDAAPGGNLVGNVLNNDAVLSSNRVVGATVSQGFGPVTASVQLSKNSNFKDNTADVQSNNGYLVGLQYAQGPISAGFAYQSLKNATNAVAAVPSDTTVTPIVLGSAAVPATDTTQKIAIVGGSYDLQVAKLFAEYASIKNDDNLNSAASSKKTYESIGVDVPFSSAAMAFVQLSHGTVDASTAVSQSISGYTVGGKYIMSKATYGYLSIGNTKLDQSGTATGIKVDQYVLGLVHTF